MKALYKATSLYLFTFKGKHKENCYTCRRETFVIDWQRYCGMLLNSPGGSTLQWGAWRGLMRLAPPVTVVIQ